MTDTSKSDISGNFSETIAELVQNFINNLETEGKDTIAEVTSEIYNLNPITLLGAAKIGQFLLFLKEKLKPKRFKEALAESLGWISGIANQLIKLAPILGNFTIKELYQITENLSPAALYKLAAGRTPLQVIKLTLEKACAQEVSQKDIQHETKNYKDAQPKKEPTPWRYVGNGREYQPPRLSEKAGLVVEHLKEQNGTPRRFLLEDAVLLLAEKFNLENFGIP